jgi:hypothetical protein
LNTTIAKVKEQVWFKGVEEACKSHVDTCAICLALRLVRKSINGTNATKVVLNTELLRSVVVGLMKKRLV